MNTYIIATMTTGVAVVCLWLVYLLNRALDRNHKLKELNDIALSINRDLDKEIALLRKNPDSYTVHCVHNKVSVIAHHDKYISVVKVFDIADQSEADYIKNCAQELVDMLEVNP